MALAGLPVGCQCSRPLTDRLSSQLGPRRPRDQPAATSQAGPKLGNRPSGFQRNSFLSELVCIELEADQEYAIMLEARLRRRPGHMSEGSGQCQGWGRCRCSWSSLPSAFATQLLQTDHNRRCKTRERCIGTHRLGRSAGGCEGRRRL